MHTLTSEDIVDRSSTRTCCATLQLRWVDTVASITPCELQKQPEFPNRETAGREISRQHVIDDMGFIIHNSEYITHVESGLETNTPECS
jgi:hypothetical protein